MPLRRRIFLYLIGFFIGGLLAYAFYGKRLTSGDWLPEQRVKLRLASTLVAARPHARQQLQEMELQLSDLRGAMREASMNFSDSRRTDDSIYYHLEADLPGGPASLVVAVLRDFDRDSTATLWDIHRK